jgi:UDP-2-acetamido-3-amino-2,3-dideoxy-glucuronate N-acetyltransferase
LEFLSKDFEKPANVRLGHGIIVYGKTKIGENTYIGDWSILGAPSFRSIKNDVEGSGCRIGKNCLLRQYNIIYEDADIRDEVETSAFLHIRENTVIGEKTYLSTHVCVEAGAILGSRVRIAEHAIIGKGCIIEDDSFLGGSSMLAWDKKMDGTHTPVVLERGSRVADNVTVVGGFRIGMGSIIGANSVVTCNIPAWSIAYGVPAKVARKVTLEEMRIFNEVLEKRYGKTRPSMLDLYVESQ